MPIPVEALLDPLAPRKADDEGVKTTRIPPFEEPVHIKTLHRCEDLLIVAKPYDLRIDGRGFGQTLERFVTREVPMDKFRLVHQLDFATSGVITLGLTKKGAGKAGVLFSRRHTEKFFVAIGVGHCEKPLGEAFRVTLPIEAVPDDFRMKIADSPDEGKHAETLVVPLFNGHAKATLQRGEQMGEEKIQGAKICMFLLKPISGRRHQLRLHLHAIGHTILGDATYGARPRPTARMYLHAWRLKLPLPDGAVAAEARLEGEDDFSAAFDEIIDAQSLVHDAWENLTSHLDDSICWFFKLIHYKV